MKKKVLSLFVSSVLVCLCCLNISAETQNEAIQQDEPFGEQNAEWFMHEKESILEYYGITEITATCPNGQHSYMSVGSATPTCTEPGGTIYLCTKCSDLYYSQPALGHSYSNYVCTQLVSCGKVNTTNSSHFQNFMYRKGYHARHIPSGGGWLGYSGHRAIDVTNGSGTSISGFPIYAQGPGEVVFVSGSSTSTAGFYVVIAYDNGYVARYLHVEQNGRVSVGNRVSSQTRIAYTGNTGKDTNGDSYGYHLHHDVINQNNVNSDYSNLGMSNSNNINPTTLFPSGTFS